MITVVSSKSGLKYRCTAVNRHQGEGATLPCQDCKKIKTWQGSKPQSCNLCHVPFDFKNTKFFIDGRTAFGPWAIMCEACHRDQAIGLGIGKGQKYSTETLEKVEG